MYINFLSAVAIMVGYVIGIGMFGLPFVVSKAGILAFFLFLVIFGVIQYFIHLIYANLIIATSSFHRMPGYARIYLGRAGEIAVFIAKMVGNLGALLAYIIITGIFAHELLHSFIGGSEFLYGSILFLIGAIIVFFGINIIAKTELLMFLFLLIVVILIAWKGQGAIIISNYNILDWKYFLVTYGVMLMALDGNGAVPIVAKILKKDAHLIKKAIRWGGSIIPILIISIFTLTIVGISGNNTTPDALVGVRAVLNDGVIFFSLIFGILTMVTSFLLVAESIKETLWWDFGVNKYIAWFLAVFIPYFFYILGVRNLTKVIGFAGGVAGGISAIILILVFRQMKKDDKKIIIFKYKSNNALLYFLIGIFVCGISYELFNFIVN